MTSDTTDRARASGDIYDSTRLAAAYAVARPAVHPHVMRLIAQHLGISGETRCRRALDIGCGAGLSTTALRRVAHAVIGVDPAVAMLAHHTAIAPEAGFVAARAEALPFTRAAFDIITAAGALNYAAIGSALAEIARVLAPAGMLVVYDFGGGRHFRESKDLDAWFTLFEHRYPSPPGYALDVTALDYRRFGLRLSACQPFEAWLPFSHRDYLAYVLSETSVELAIRSGAALSDIQLWCGTTLRPVFGDDLREVLFEGYVAYITPNV